MRVATHDDGLPGPGSKWRSQQRQDRIPASTLRPELKGDALRFGCPRGRVDVETSNFTVETNPRKSQPLLQ
eukprot:536811-Prymnesium_polylepis.1